MRSTAPPDAHAHFAEHGYARVAGAMDEAVRSLCASYALRKARGSAAHPLGAFELCTQVPEGALRLYGDELMQSVLAGMQPLMEGITGKELTPTYAFTRLYFEGSELKRHTDRPACEFSASVTLAYRDGSPWPLHIEGPQGVAEIALAPGDLIAYRGELPHWREAYHGTGCMQVFLHYVDAAGPNAGEAFDGKEGNRPATWDEVARVYRKQRALLDLQARVRDVTQDGEQSAHSAE